MFVFGVNKTTPFLRFAQNADFSLQELAIMLMYLKSGGYYNQLCELVEENLNDSQKSKLRDKLLAIENILQITSANNPINLLEAAKQPAVDPLQEINQ